MTASKRKTMTVPIPDPSKRARLAGLGFQTPAGAKRALRVRKTLRPSEWASRYRVLTQSRYKGLWRKDVNPYLSGILDAAAFRSVETIIICAAPQTGKTEVVHTYHGYSMDMAPGPILSIYPNEKQAREASKDRIGPMIKASPRLSEYLTGLDDDVSSYRIRLRHTSIFMAWANSASQLADRPVRYVDFQEVDKYPETASKKETDPISLGEKRARTYRGIRKIFKTSSPTVEAGPIWQAYTNEADVRFDLYVRCPHCDDSHVMVFDQIRWPEGERDPNRVYSKNLAWYECPACGEKWDDYDRDRAVAASVWRARAKKDSHRPTQTNTDVGANNYSPLQEPGLTVNRYLLKHQPKTIAFQIPSWVSQFVTLSEPAAAFLKGQKSKTALKDFMNSHKAEPWVEYEQIKKEDEILALADDRPAGVVPGDGDLVACLTAGIDTQDYGFWYEVRAWGWGMEMESWQIRHGYVESWEALTRVLKDDEYKDTAGNVYAIHIAVQDAMGHRTAAVYDWARQHRRFIVPFKGEQRMTAPQAFTKIDVYPGTNKPIPGGLKLLRANVNHYKDLLSNKLEVPAADPGAWHLHREVSIDWARQMCAEYVNDKGLWECMGGRDNHAWDVSVYNLVAADLIGVKYWKKMAQGVGRKAQGAGANDYSPVQDGGWVKPRGGWMRR